jgi:uncharacterized protein YndB with AHSA1/START domain
MPETVPLAPVVKSVHVRCGIEHAFDVFTAGIGTWWPLEQFSIHGEQAQVVWEEQVGGEVYELSSSGEKAHWARVLAWEPPVRLVIAWHVSPDTDAPTEVEVRFSPEGDGTRVDLEHRRWEQSGAGAAEQRAGYDRGWETVLGRFVAAVAPIA